MIEEALKVCSGLYRVGYYWDDTQIAGLFGQNGQSAARISAFTTLRHELSQGPFRPNMMVQEYDGSRLIEFDKALNVTNHLEQLTQLQLLDNCIDNFLADCIGYYYAPQERLSNLCH